MVKAKQTPVVDSAKSMGDEVFRLGRNVWLFGLGAVATAEDGFRSTLDSMISRGENLEKDLEGERESMLSKASGKARDIGGMVEDRVHDVVSGALSLAGVPNRDEIRMLIDRVEVLTDKVDALGSRRLSPTAS